MNKSLLLLLAAVFTAVSGASPVYAEESINVESVSQDVAPPPAANAQKPAAPAPQRVDLETAYKREYAFLEVQKRELNDRLKKYLASTQGEIRELHNKITVMDRASIDRSARIDKLSVLLAEAERSEASAIEHSDILEITYSQAEMTLKNHDREIPPVLMEAKDNDTAKITYLFDQALAVLRESSTIRTAQGTFFLENGTQTQGEIIRLGNIAAYGISAESSGNLVPAGGGELKIWHESTADSAIALSKNQQPDTLQLFLFEARTQNIEETTKKTIKEFIDSGGIIGWIIVSLGGITVLLVLVRIYLLRANSSDTRQITDKIIQEVIDGNLENAKKSCETGSSAITRVLSSTLRHLKDDRDHMESVVHEAILSESGALDRFGSTILVIAAVAPLLGLLGTVTGMIATFDVITEFGSGDPSQLSGSISLALVTTELGLIVAIPAMLIGSMLSAWAKSIKRDMEHAALRVINSFLGKPILNPEQPENKVAAFAAAPLTPTLGNPAN